jgi:predicted MFS family arabinose efflux permease
MPAEAQRREFERNAVPARRSAIHSIQLGLRLFLPFAAGYFLSYLLRNVNAVIAPELTRELGVSAADLGLLTSAYLLTFSAFQLPLGILLDRYGPRRVEATLLLIAAAGSAWFAHGTSLGDLALARAMIGLGVCACLMAAFKAFSVWFPVERLPSLNAAVMVAGGLGALAATTPLAWAAPMLGRRGLFMVLAALTVLAALGIYSTPDKPTAAAGGTLGQQLRELGQVLRSREFWRYAPMTATGLGSFVALQGLWAVPWLMQVSEQTREVAAFHMLLMTLAMVCGFLGTALFIGPLGRRGVPPGRVMAMGNAVGLAVMLALWSGVGSTHVLWFVLGIVFALGNLAYADITRRFAPTLAGRVNAALNLATFIGAFSIQWGYGVTLDALIASGWTTVESHRAAFATLLALQTAGLGWFLWNRRQAGSAAAVVADGAD